jgi:DNA-damage-inducible protein J
MTEKREIEKVELKNACSYNGATSKGDVMAADAIVRARVSEETKVEAAAIFEAAGLTTSDAIRMMLVRAVEDGALPFDPVKPNAKTVRAIKAARAGKVKKAKSSKQLLTKLNARA